MPLKEGSTMRKVYLAAILAVAFGPLPALAQQSGAMYEGQLNQLDTSKDGAVSKAEYQSFMNGAFAKLDKNANGSLDKAEVKGVLTPQQFGSLDKNSDGKVSKKEFMNQVMSDFASADHNGDGTLK
jgi:Ca2+-binding EF-hand superfamily protein